MSMLCDLLPPCMLIGWDETIMLDFTLCLILHFPPCCILQNSSIGPHADADHASNRKADKINVAHLMC